MSTPTADLFEAAESLLTQMTAHATGGDADDQEYKRARKAILSRPEIAKLAPSFVRFCRNPSQFWGYIKPKFGTYAERRTFLAEQFEPLLSALERFEQSPVDNLVAEAAETFNSASVSAAWQKALDRRHTDPGGAITAARTLLESVCKSILDDSEVEYGNDDLPKLYRKVAVELNLAPSQHTEQQFKRILGGCQSVIEGLGSVRNRDGDSHGQGRQVVKPAPRHAALAVNLSGSMAVFLVETWERQQKDRENS